jgi:hypothetical protein
VEINHDLSRKIRVEETAGREQRKFEIAKQDAASSPVFVGSRVSHHTESTAALSLPPKGASPLTPQFADLHFLRRQIPP